MEKVAVSMATFSINHESLAPKPILNPGEEYHQLCIYKFAVLPKVKKK